MPATAIVTGGTGGLGVAVTERLLSDGWRVVVPSHEQSGAQRLGSHERLELVEADMLDPASVREVVAKAGEELTAAVNLIGGYAEGGRVHETTLEDFEAQLRLNLRPTYLTSAAALPLLIEHDSSAIVCVSARPALRPFPGVVGYATAKAAVLALVDVIDAEYRGDGVRANAILPSVIDTPANRSAMPKADFSKWVAPERIAGVIAGLVADDSPVTGSRIQVYGRA